MALTKGRYRRLVDTQMRDSQLDLATLRELLYGNRKEVEEEVTPAADEDIYVRDTRGDLSRARAMALKDWKRMAMGTHFVLIILNTISTTSL